ncbi:hypothetical protein UGMREWDR_CDS0064 [Aeromonas phage GomatiRiver_11]|nr:hypothetical protein OBDJBBDK_00059 [Aeromonas phage AhFM11]WKW84231.1 hypothetical protein UGMREWDR_CDS0064 [Aeromonas phage GomatiRiver_11]
MKKYTFDEVMKGIGYVKVDSLAVLESSLEGIEAIIDANMITFPCWVKRVGSYFDSFYDVQWVCFDFVPLSD